MSLIKWSGEYTLKMPEIDKEHKELAEKINHLYESMLTGRDCEVLKKLGNELYSYAEKHFRNQEKIMKRAGFPDSDSHKLSHDKLLKKLKELMNNSLTDVMMDNYKLALLDDWCLDHILTEDKKYALYIIKKGVQ